MTSFTTSSLAVRLLGRTGLLLCLVPSSVLGAVPTVHINGTSIFGTSQLSSNSVTVEFFGGQCTVTRAAFMASGLTSFVFAFTFGQGYRMRNRLSGSYDSHHLRRSRLSLSLF